MRVIGTAGHVDHGKSTLIQALTGIHPDRLKEEREREMTIDLGFAWMTLPESEYLPDGEEVGFIDVPGHRDFIANMLAGVGGIDAALFVVAADEGIMPQTREHLAILNILQIQAGVIALTKVDLVDDEAWLLMVEDDLHNLLRGTVLDGAPIVRVSSRTGQGMTELISAISLTLSKKPARPDLSRPRLPVDRVFSMPGFGTIVTGTLLDGCLHVGDEVVLLGGILGERRARVRGLQTHKQKEDLAVPGSRTAVNLVGIAVDQINRGDVVAHPNDYFPTKRIDVSFHLLPDVSQPLRHNNEVKLFLGAAEVIARVRLLGVDELVPGEIGWLQLELDHAVVAVRGDRYILRRPSPAETLGGGEVLDPHPASRHKRFSEEVLTRLTTLAQGSPEGILLQVLRGAGIATLQEIIARSNLEAGTVYRVIAQLIGEGKLIKLEDEGSSSALSDHSVLLSREYWEQKTNQAIWELDSYHQMYPLRQGIPREEFKSRLQMPTKLLNAALRQWMQEGKVVERGLILSRPSHIIRLNPSQQALVDKLLKRFEAAPYAPPTVKECVAEVGEEIFNALVERGDFICVSNEVVFRQSNFEEMVEIVKKLLEKHGTITAAEVRDYFGTSRRYILAFLEYLDAMGITVREGDVRRLKTSTK